MLTPPQIRRRLSDGAAAVLRSDGAALDETTSWLTAVAARELLRIDYCARQVHYERPTLGQSQQWSRVLASRAFFADVEAGLADLAHLPTLIVWGDADIAFRPQERERLEATFPSTRP